MSGYLLKFKQTYSVNIGGRRYPVVKIGNQLWMAENLDWKFEGCVIGTGDMTTTEPRGNYYNNDENTYGINGNKYGLLYNWPSAKSINDMLTDGWRVPSLEDISILSNYLVDNQSLKLKSSSGWYDGGNGTDEYGFSAVPTGFRQTDFMNVGKSNVLWTMTQIGTYDSQARGFSYDRTGNLYGGFGTNKGFRFSIRLVKSLT